MDNKIRLGYCRETARKILKQFNISTPPVDIIKILKNKGYIYKEVSNFPDKLSALLVEKDDVYYAAVNKNHATTRKRFSLAHELGHKELFHKVLHYDAPITIDNPPINPYLQHELNQKYLESEADEFAGELLVPLNFLKEAFKEGLRELNDLAKLFNVSSAVVSIRLMNNQKLLFK